MMRAAKPATPTPIFWALRGRAPYANAAAAKHHAKELAHNTGKARGDAGGGGGGGGCGGAGGAAGAPGELPPGSHPGRT